MNTSKEMIGSFQQNAEVGWLGVDSAKGRFCQNVDLGMGQKL